MQTGRNSNWLSPTVELIKCLEDTKKSTVNEEMHSIDYVIDDEGSKKLLRAIIDENNNAAPVYVDAIRSTLEELKEEKYDEAVILSKRMTKAGHKIVKQQENLNILTPNMKHNFSLMEVALAIQTKIRRLCKAKCGKPPEKREDCRGKKGRKYICDVRRISDDATFHATMKWKDVLLEDFNNLCKYEKSMLEMN
jgi:hypothetical protein